MHYDGHIPIITSSLTMLNVLHAGALSKATVLMQGKTNEYLAFIKKPMYSYRNQPKRKILSAIQVLYFWRYRTPNT